MLSHHFAYAYLCHLASDSQCIVQGEIFLFGGEYFDGKADKQYTYADLYKYHTTKNQWTRLIIPRGSVPISN